MNSMWSAAICLTALIAMPQDLKQKVGPAGRDEMVLPTRQMVKPVGMSVAVSGRPVDIRLSRDGKRLFVKDRDVLRIFEPSTMKELQAVSSPGGASLIGLCVSKEGDKVWMTNAENGLHEFGRKADGTFALLRTITLPGPSGKGASFPCGIVVSKDEKTAYVCLSRNNTLGSIDLTKGTLVAQYAVGVAPYEVTLSEDGSQAYVSNQGGRKPRPGEKRADSAGTETAVEDNGIAASGTVSEVDLHSGKELRQYTVGLQPAGMTWVLGQTLAVANANGDTVSFLDTNTRQEPYRLSVRPSSGLPFGSMPTAVATSPDGKKLFVANAGNNALVVIDLVPTTPVVIGYLPVAWFPTGIAIGNDAIYVCNAKGWGSRTVKRPAKQGQNSHDHSGTVQRIPLGELAKLAAHTKAVQDLAYVPQMLAAMERKDSKSAKAVPLPAKLGAPSVFEHVIYVIKENRTYDQVFGDIKSGNGDPALCMFGEQITPNQHALAKQFVLLDNYYCNGVLSADGHSWATEGNVTPYLERAFGGFNRSYTYGDDPITYSSSGFLWDRILGAGLSFRNYGEFDTATIPGGQKLSDILSARAKGEKVEFGHAIGVERVRNYSMMDCPGWNMEIPDQVRMDCFLKEFEEFKKNGRLPNLVIIYLPQNHTGGSVTAKAHVADNDYAVGRLIEAVSNSAYWKNTAVFINEDDPQNGFDHVDGHRSVCTVASAYTRNRRTDSSFYNQTSVLRTILHIFGLPPMTQSEAVAPLMFGCFGSKADLTPFRAISPRVKLDEKYPPKSALTGPELYWANVRESIPMARTGMKTAGDDDRFNRALWHEMMGFNTPYPVAYAGPHGKGLKKLGLTHSNEDND